MTKPNATDATLAALAAEVFTLIDPEALAEHDELLLKARDLRDALAVRASGGQRIDEVERLMGRSPEPAAV